MTQDSLLNEQVAYYRARAMQYDEWHARQGRYDRGESHRRQWFAELDLVRSALDETGELGMCLELACGTGLWTPQLVRRCVSLTAIDAARETIEINRTKIRHAPVRYLVADLFQWWPEEKFDFVFFGFWLSHVPPKRFDQFWDMVRAALKPGGRVFFVDSLENQESTATDHSRIDDSGIVERKLNDGRTFSVVKVFYEPDQLKKRLHQKGWMGRVEGTGQFFFHGCVTPIVGR